MGSSIAQEQVRSALLEAVFRDTVPGGGMWHKYADALTWADVWAGNGITGIKEQGSAGRA